MRNVTHSCCCIESVDACTPEPRTHAHPASQSLTKLLSNVTPSTIARLHPAASLASSILPSLTTMSKRPADEPLEVLEIRRGSPTATTPKRLRSEDYDGGDQEHKSSHPPSPPKEGREESADDDVEDDVDEDQAAAQKPEGPTEGFSDLYLDTVNRYHLPRRLFCSTICYSLNG